MATSVKSTRNMMTAKCIFFRKMKYINKLSGYRKKSGCRIRTSERKYYFRPRTDFLKVWFFQTTLVTIRVVICVPIHLLLLILLLPLECRKHSSSFSYSIIYRRINTHRHVVNVSCFIPPHNCKLSLIIVYRCWELNLLLVKLPKHSRDVFGKSKSISNIHLLPDVKYKFTYLVRETNLW